MYLKSPKRRLSVNLNCIAPRNVFSKYSDQSIKMEIDVRHRKSQKPYFSAIKYIYIYIYIYIELNYTIYDILYYIYMLHIYLFIQHFLLYISIYWSYHTFLN